MTRGRDGPARFGSRWSLDFRQFFPLIMTMKCVDPGLDASGPYKVNPDVDEACAMVADRGATVRLSPYRHSRLSVVMFACLRAAWLGFSHDATESDNTSRVGSFRIGQCRMMWREVDACKGNPIIHGQDRSIRYAD